MCVVSSLCWSSSLYLVSRLYFVSSLCWMSNLNVVSRLYFVSSHLMADMRIVAGTAGVPEEPCFLK